MRSRPPFSKTETNVDYVPHSNIEKIAYQYVISHHLSWATAHINAAKSYVNTGDFEAGLKEFKAILVSDMDNPYVLKLAGDMCLQLQKYVQAEMYYLKAYNFNSSQFIEYKLGKTEMLLGKPSNAIQFFNNCLEKNKVSPDKFSYSEVEDINYSLAQAYNQVKEPGKANEVMRRLMGNVH